MRQMSDVASGRPVRAQKVRGCGKRQSHRRPRPLVSYCLVRMAIPAARSLTTISRSVQTAGTHWRPQTLSVHPPSVLRVCVIQVANGDALQAQALSDRTMSEPAAQPENPAVVEPFVLTHAEHCKAATPRRVETVAAHFFSWPDAAKGSVPLKSSWNVTVALALG